MEQGGLFLHEHSSTALSWGMDCIKDIRGHTDVMTIEVFGAELGQLGVANGAQTRLMSNSPAILSKAREAMKPSTGATSERHKKMQEAIHQGMHHGAIVEQKVPDGKPEAHHQEEEAEEEARRLRIAGIDIPIEVAEAGLPDGGAYLADAPELVKGYAPWTAATAYRRRSWRWGPERRGRSTRESLA